LNLQWSLVTQGALEHASKTITDWWDGAFLAGNAPTAREAAA
jgi:hypothetical protein